MPIEQHVNRRMRAAQKAEADKRRGSARERGYTPEWDRFAKNWIASHPLCFYCENQGRTSPAEVVDHIDPHNGDPGAFWPHPSLQDWSTFFASCCHNCHNGQKQRAERIAKKRGKNLRHLMYQWGMLPPGFPGPHTRDPARDRR